MQCTHPATGEISDWLFTGPNWRDLESAVSPAFSDCVVLFEWAKDNGWESVGYDYVYRGAGTHGQRVSNYMANKHPDVI